MALVLAAGLVDLGVSDLPNWLFVLIHVAILAAAVYFAVRSLGWQRELPAGTGGNLSRYSIAFFLFGAAEVLYLLYHLYFTTFLLAQLLAEVCDVAAFALVFVALADRVGSVRAG